MLLFLFVYLLYALGVAIILFLILFNVVPYFFGAPYVATTDHKSEIMMKLACIKKGNLAADLGSGEGKLVIAMAKKGAIVHGYEINPILVWRSRNFIREQGLSDRAFIHWKSFWDEDLTKFDVITLYGITYIMKRLEKKLMRELKPGAKVVSNYFKFPNWKPAATSGEILLYIRS